MLESLSNELLGTAAGVWSVLFVLFLRIGSAMFLLPVFGSVRVPARVRLILAGMLVLLVFVSLDLPAAASANLAVGLSEITTGVILGLSVRMALFALEICGTIAAQATSLAQMFGGTNGPEPHSAVGNLLIMAALAYACLAGLHVKIVEFFLLSYAVWPAGELWITSEITATGVAQISRCFAFAFSLAAPFFLVSVLYNITLGIINKAMPQLMVAFIGAPAITGASMLLMLAFFPLMIEHWHNALVWILRNPGGALP